MTQDELKQVMLEGKYARIINCISDMYKIPLDKAMDILYRSETFNLINEGVADLHCRSDKYLASEVWQEYQENQGE